MEADYKDENVKALVELIAKRGMHISCAESCTGGMLMAKLVSVPSVSSVFNGGFVTYSVHMKSRMLGIDEKLIENYGVVSERTAGEMARGCAEKTGAEIGIGITGVAGPSGGTQDIPVGTVCFGFFVNVEIIATKTMHFGEKGRNIVRALSTDYAIDTLMLYLKNITE